MSTITDASPMMRQWHACKAKSAGSLLFFRLGDFYEAFFEDAEVIARELDLTLTKRQETPMCGVPFHTAEGYIDKLVAKGFKVAVAEQIDDPKETKGIVRRDVVRIVTPGTVVTSSLLSEKSNNYIVSLSKLNASIGLSTLDVTTGEFRATEIESDSLLLDELSRLSPSEIILSEKTALHLEKMLVDLGHVYKFSTTRKAEWHYDHRSALERLQRHFKVLSLDGFGLAGKTAAINASGALLAYVSDDLSLPTSHIRELKVDTLSDYMALDRSTMAHLELLDSFSKHLDHTSTPMGGRLLKSWISHPLLSVEKIGARQEGVVALMQNRKTSAKLREHLKEIRDLERLIMRLSSGYGSARDLVALKNSLQQIPHVQSILYGIEAPLLANAAEHLTPPPGLTELIGKAIVDAPPLRLSDSGIIRDGYNAQLDELRQLQLGSQEWLANYQTMLRDQLGIKTLKVSYTKAFGFYIDVSRGQSHLMPDSFARRQTLVSNERFISPELKEFEHKVLSAEDKIAHIEKTLFEEVRAEAASHAALIATIATHIATIDVLLAFATVAERHGYTRPLVDTSDILSIQGGRHPVLEALLGEGTFIANDTFLGVNATRLYLITGPNMAGKSTFLRQTALITIMAQIGCFVSAEKAHIGIVDKVFSRIGASDDLLRGKSTFMVEMSETANILNSATDKSLVILDEIGRGTSTYDGIAIAWAVAEYLLKTPGQKAKTLFATHYAELNALEGLIPGATNYNVAVHEGDGEIVFLHKIRRGGTDKSYGIHVAKLAGLPPAAIKCAEKRLAGLQTAPKASKPKPPDLFSLLAPEHPMIAELKKLDINTLTPLSALQLLSQWKSTL